VTFPRQLAPTVEPTREGVVFLEGALRGMEGIAVGRMTKSRRDKLYIDNAAWGPEVDSVESGYRVPVGPIHLFIGKIDGSEPEPDHAVPTEYASRLVASSTHAFVGFISGSTEPERSVENVEDDDSLELSDVDSYPSEGEYTDTGSIRPIGDNRLGGNPDECPYTPPLGSPLHTTIYMADTGVDESPSQEN